MHNSAKKLTVYSTWPPLVVENILAVPPHCLTYHRNQRAETSCGSEVTSTFTNRVANLLAALHSKPTQINNIKSNDVHVVLPTKTMSL